MRRIHLLTLLIVLTTCLGSQCAGGGDSQATAAATTPIEGPSEEIDRETGPVAPTPEPSAALVFGVGLLIACAASRHRQ